MSLGTIAVLGLGSWGTALAALWERKGESVVLWGREPRAVQRIRDAGENSKYLPGVRLPDSIRLTSQIGDCASAAIIAFVTPSIALREVATRCKEIGARHDPILVSCTKGIEHGSGMRMSEILGGIFPDRTVAVLSGPNLASEVAKGLPTASVLGCAQTECATMLQSRLGSERFRIYTSDQVAGVELGGALKNVFAIAAGVSEGLRLGENAKAALVTRALAELVRLGTAMGGDARTFYGLSGAGDLVLTCFSGRSRNHDVGKRLGQGELLTQIRSSMQMVAEGIPTTRSAYECARKLNVDTPVIDQVYAMLYEGKAPTDALHELLRRDQKAE